MTDLQGLRDLEGLYHRLTWVALDWLIRHIEQLDEDWLLRETRMRGDLSVLDLPKWDRTIEADFGPCEIKTFRMPRPAARPVVETNLLEWIEE